MLNMARDNANGIYTEVLEQYKLAGSIPYWDERCEVYRDMYAQLARLFVLAYRTTNVSICGFDRINAAHKSAEGKYSPILDTVSSFDYVRSVSYFRLLSSFIQGGTPPFTYDSDFVSKSIVDVCNAVDAYLRAKKERRPQLVREFRHIIPDIDGMCIRVWARGVWRQCTSCVDVEDFSEWVRKACLKANPALAPSLDKEGLTLKDLCEGRGGEQDVRLAKFLSECDLNNCSALDRATYLEGVVYICTECEHGTYYHRRSGEWNSKVLFSSGSIVELKALSRKAKDSEITPLSLTDNTPKQSEGHDESDLYRVLHKYGLLDSVSSIAASRNVSLSEAISLAVRRFK